MAGSAARTIRSDEEAISVARELAVAFAATASDIDRSRELPLNELNLLAQSGILGIKVPKAHGGAEVSYLTVVRVFAILSAASGSLGQIPQNHFHLIDAIFRDGTEEQKRFFAKEILDGKRFGNALSERTKQPVLSLPTTRIRVTENGYAVSGVKYYSTGALTAQWIPVYTAADDGQTALVFIPRDAPGVEVVNDWDAMGQRATHSGTVKLDDVRIPSVYGLVPWAGFTAPGTFGPYAILMHAAVDIGIGKGALVAGRDFIIGESRPWGAANVQAACDDPLTIYQFGKLATHLHAAEALVEEAARALAHAETENTDIASWEAAVTVAEASAFAGEAAERLASEIISLAGARSTSDKVNLHRFWRDSRTHTTHDPIRWKYHRAGDWYLNKRLKTAI